MIIRQDPDTGYFTTGLRAVHDPVLCDGRGCAIHNHPSAHPLADAPLNWRTDRGIMERICEHGIGHADPDGIAYIRMVAGDDVAEAEAVHGCDGCC